MDSMHLSGIRGAGAPLPALSPSRGEERPARANARCSCLDAVAGLPVDLRRAALPLIVVEAVGKTRGGVESSKGRLRPGPANGLSCA